MGRFGRTWELTKSSWEVLRQDKELALLPVFSAIAGLIVIGIFAVPFLAMGGDLDVETGEAAIEPMGYVLLIAGGLAVSVVTTFFTGALVAGAHQRLTGGEPTLGSALGTATERFAPLAGWAVLSGTVGLLLGQLERFGAAGAVVRRLLDVAWALITFLTIPIVVVEGLGPVAALKRSGTLFKQTWGENMIAQFGFGLIGFVAMLPGLVVGGALAATGATALVVVGVAVIVVSVLAVSVVVSALSGIFRSALYLYAAQGVVAPPFAGSGLDAAFRPK